MRKENYFKPTVREVRLGDRIECLLAGSGPGKYGVTVGDTQVTTGTSSAKEENPNEIDAKHHQGSMSLWED